MYKIFILFFILFSGLLNFASSDEESIQLLKPCVVAHVAQTTKAELVLQGALEEAKADFAKMDALNPCCKGGKLYARKTREKIAIAHTIFNAIQAAQSGRLTYKKERVSECTKFCIGIQDECDCLKYPDRVDENFQCTSDCENGPVEIGCSADCWGEYEKRKTADRFLSLAVGKAHTCLKNIVNIPVVTSLEIER